MKPVSATEAERRAKISAAVRKRYENPEERRRVSESSKAMWDRPGYRENMARKALSYWETPGAKEKRGEAIKRAFENSPDARINQSKSMKERWDNPDYRAKMKACMEGKQPRGAAMWNWKGGRKKQTRGYIRALCPGHPFADPRGYVMESRLVVERAIGRYLKPTEVVHHVNGVTGDNRNSNLVACQDQSYHIFLHWRAGGLAKGV
jgi:hypothetical protein